ncbi:MAG: protein kinase, partial [Planctomycetales bacterium]
MKRLGRLPLDWSCECARQTALGLQHAADRGLIHRDVKPSNLLAIAQHVRMIPRMKILDMGLARFTEEESSNHDITETGQVLGTVDYISPEQARGARDVDIRSDVFSLGCTLFQLITGELPFPGTGVMEKLMARTKTARRAKTLQADLPDGLDAILAKMIELDPDDRFQTPRELAQALEPYSIINSPDAVEGQEHAATPAPEFVGDDQERLDDDLYNPALFEDTIDSGAEASTANEQRIAEATLEGSPGSSSCLMPPSGKSSLSAAPSSIAAPPPLARQVPSTAPSAVPVQPVVPTAKQVPPASSISRARAVQATPPPAQSLPAMPEVSSVNPATDFAIKLDVEEKPAPSQSSRYGLLIAWIVVFSVLAVIVITAMVLGLG